MRFQFIVCKVMQNWMKEYQWATYIDWGLVNS